MTANSLEKLQDLLRTLSQFDYADLDLGIYRILNHKRRQVDGLIATSPAANRGRSARSVCGGV